MRSRCTWCSSTKSRCAPTCCSHPSRSPIDGLPSSGAVSIISAALRAPFRTFHNNSLPFQHPIILYTLLAVNLPPSPAQHLLSARRTSAWGRLSTPVPHALPTNRRGRRRRCGGDGQRDETRHHPGAPPIHRFCLPLAPHVTTSFTSLPLSRSTSSGSPTPQASRPSRSQLILTNGYRVNSTPMPASEVSTTGLLDTASPSSDNKDGRNASLMTPIPCGGRAGSASSQLERRAGRCKWGKCGAGSAWGAERLRGAIWRREGNWRSELRQGMCRANSGACTVRGVLRVEPHCRVVFSTSGMTHTHAPNRRSDA